MSTDPGVPGEDRLRRVDLVRTGDLVRLAAALDLPPATEGLVPPLWHWTSFLDRTATAQLGEDGHPRSGGLVESPPYPRRMFAGARLTWSRGLPADVPLLRVAEVDGPVHKDSARSGPMAFMTVRLRYLIDGEEVGIEEQDLVYLPARTPSPAPTGEPAAGRASERPEADGSPEEDVVTRRVTTFGPEVLFRFSALTYNTHRIHYDDPYVRGVEGYPGLVVHGPLLAMQLAELVRTTHGDDALSGFAFRARSPAFAGEPLTFEGRPATDEEAAAAPGGGGSVLALTARRGGTTLMTASARLRPGAA